MTDRKGLSMITAIVKASVLPGKTEQLRHIAGVLQHQYAPREDGCIQYESFIDGSAFITIELWRDQDALDHHLAQEHVKKYVPLMRDCVEGGTFSVLFIQGGEVSRVTL